VQISDLPEVQDLLNAHRGIDYVESGLGDLVPVATLPPWPQAALPVNPNVRAAARLGLGGGFAEKHGVINRERRLRVAGGAGGNATAVAGARRRLMQTQAEKDAAIARFTKCLCAHPCSACKPDP
jgi:hypothetical protein